MKRQSFISSIIILLLITGCAKDNSDSNKSDSKFELKLSGSSSVVTKTDMPMPQGLTVGIYVPLRDSPLNSANVEFSNRLYTAGISGALTGGPVYLTTAKDYDIYGYAPYKQGILSPESIGGFTHGDDVLLATKATITGASETNNTATLLFEHSVSQISFNVVCADTDVVLGSTSSIEISGFYNSATLNLSDKKLTPSGSAPSVKASGTNGKLYIAPVCFFINKDEIMNITIKVTIGESVKSTTAEKVYNGTISRAFNAGESYMYTVNIPASSQELNLSATLTPWMESFGDIDVTNSIK